jgi:carotenoid cleavage dioxygenase
VVAIFASGKLTFTGKYRNKYTDAVELKIRTTANTNVLYFNGRLLACKEDAPPYSLDPESLETIGLEDFNGQLPCLTFTAHPKLDHTTGELVCFGYEAKGDGTPDVCYFTVNKEDKVVETVWLISPVVAMIHDFAITENWVCSIQASRAAYAYMCRYFSLSYHKRATLNA